MKKYNLIILAGGDKDSWCTQYGCTKKALLPINGKPMLDHVVEAFQKSKYIDNIIVVGPKELERLDSMRHVRKHLHDKNSLVGNLLYAAMYLKTVIYKFANKHNGYLISFCDAAFLNTDIIDDTLRNMSQYDPGLVLHYVKKETLTEAGFPAEDRSYLPINGKPHTGANIYYVKKIRELFRVLTGLVAIRNRRKEPHKILEYLGCEGQEFPYIEKVVGQRMGTNVKIFVSPHAEMGVDVDKPIDYELAKDYYAKRSELKPAHNPERMEKPILHTTGATEPFWKTIRSEFAFTRKTLLLIVAVVLTFIAAKYWQGSISVHQLFEYVEGMGIWAPISYVALYILISGILIPSILFKIFAGTLFGVTNGVVLVSIASTISSLIKFLLARYFFRDSVAQKIRQNPKLRNIDNVIKKDGWKILIMLRNVPVVSSMFLNYICGVTKMRTNDFIVASFIGRLPQTIMYAYMGYMLGYTAGLEAENAMYRTFEWVVLFIGLAATIGFSFYMIHLSKKILAQKNLTIYVFRLMF